MPSLDEKEMMVALAQARLMECTTYTSTNNSMYFFDKEKMLRIRVRKGYDMWIGKTEFPADGIWQQGNLANLRKRYESRTSESDD